MTHDTIKFLRALVLDNLENQLDCGLDMNNPTDARELMTYTTTCLVALKNLEQAEYNLSQKG